MGAAAERIPLAARWLRTGSSEVVETSVPGESEARTSATTFSFSSGSSEQVE